MSVPTKCFLLTTRNDCFCPEKSVYFTMSEAEAECAEIAFAKNDIQTNIVPCIIMPEETFYELCPEWKK